MCIRAYLNGDGMGDKTHLSLFFVIMKGVLDALLSWPFQSRNTLTLINQDNHSGDVCEVFRANPQSKSFKQPIGEMNIASGCPKFVPLEYLNNPSYVKQDVLYIHTYHTAYLHTKMYAHLTQCTYPLLYSYTHIHTYYIHLQGQNKLSGISGSCEWFKT